MLKWANICTTKTEQVYLTDEAFETSTVVRRMKRRIIQRNEADLYQYFGQRVKRQVKIEGYSLSKKRRIVIKKKTKNRDLILMKRKELTVKFKPFVKMKRSRSRCLPEGQYLESNISKTTPREIEADKFETSV